MQHGTPDSQRDTEFSFFASHGIGHVGVHHLGTSLNGDEQSFLDRAVIYLKYNCNNPLKVHGT